MRNFWIGFGMILLLTACQPGRMFSVAPSNFGEVGNGGHGIKLGDKIYLYDLWEAGIEKGSEFPFTTKSLGPMIEHQKVRGFTVGSMTATDHTLEFFTDQLRKSIS